MKSALYISGLGLVAAATTSKLMQGMHVTDVLSMRVKNEATNAAPGRAKVASDDHTTVNFLDQQTYTDGYLVVTVFDGDDEKCKNSPAAVVYTAIGECLKADDGTSTRIESLADTQLSGYYSYTFSSFNNTECIGETVVFGKYLNLTYTTFIFEHESVLLVKDCDNYASLSWVQDIPSTEELGSTYGAGLLETLYYDNSECIWQEDPVQGYYVVNKCAEETSWTYGDTNYGLLAPIYCQDFGGSTNNHDATIKTHIIALNNQSGSDICLETAVESASLLYDCNAAAGDFFSAINKVFFRYQCVDGDSFNNINIAENSTSYFMLPEFEDTPLTVNKTHFNQFVTIAQFNESVNDRCGDEPTSWQIIHTDVCVPLPLYDTYVKFHSAESNAIRYHFNVTVYADIDCTVPEPTLRFASNCSLFEEDCYFGPTHDECSSLAVSSAVPMGVNYGIETSFPFGTKTGHVIHKYYASEDECRNGDDQDVTSADVYARGVCLSFPAALTGSNVEAPNVEGLSFIIEDTTDNDYTLSVYASADCSEDDYITSVTQPHYTCSLTEKGYVNVYTYQGSKHYVVPHDAIYALLVLLILGPCLFFIAVKVGRAMGWFEAKAPPAEATEFEMNKA